MKSHKEKQEMKKELFEAEKARKIDAAKEDAEKNRRTTSNAAAISAAAGGAATVVSSENVRNIAEARELMAEMESNRLSINPSQVTETMNERSTAAAEETSAEDTKGSDE
jgi:hypothetical protein